MILLERAAAELERQFDQADPLHTIKDIEVFIANADRGLQFLRSGVGQGYSSRQRFSFHFHEALFVT